MLPKCFQHHQQFLKHGWLSVHQLLGYFSVIKLFVLYRLMTQSKVLRCNLGLVIFHFKPLCMGLYAIPWYHRFISIKIPHVQAPQLAAVTIDPQPQGFVHGFKVDHWQFSASPLGLNKKWRQQESSSKQLPHNGDENSNYGYSDDYVVDVIL